LKKNVAITVNISQVGVFLINDAHNFYHYLLIGMSLLIFGRKSLKERDVINSLLLKCEMINNATNK